VGSFCSEKFIITLTHRWMWPFLGIEIAGLFLLVIYPYIFHVFLASPMLLRILIAMILIFPLGFFLGMPFPLGILGLQNQPKGAIAWAWGLNGLFTVIGGLASVVLSLFLGFKATLLVALGLYVLAFWLFARIRRLAPSFLDGVTDSSYEFSRESGN
jgi:hypothetical protein